MARRLQQESGEERVTAKSRPMMNLIARDPSHLSSSTSESSGKRSYGNQDPWSAKAERERERMERGNPLWAAIQKTCRTIITNNVLKALSQHATYSTWDDNKAWSSQERKADKTMGDRTEQPVVTSWGTTRESQPGFFHEKIQRDGTAQSVVNEAKPRDRTGATRCDPSKRN